jgi:hypothetical protein
MSAEKTVEMNTSVTTPADSNVLQSSYSLPATLDELTPKIKFFRDGTIILNTLLALFRDYKPLTFFGSAGLLFLALALVPGLIVIIEFVNTGLVRRLPLAVLAVILAGCGLLSLTVGLILHSIARRAQEFEYQFQVLAEQFGSNSVPLKTPPGSPENGR